MKRFTFFVLAALVILLGALTLLKPETPPASEPQNTVETDSLEKQRVLQFWTHYREATTHRLSGRTKKAVEEYRKALNLHPQHEDALYYLGNLYMDQGRYEDAELLLLRMVKIDSSSTRAFLQLGLLYACADNKQGNNLDAARRVLLRAFEINKEETGPLLRLGQVAILEEDWPAAAKYFDTVIGSNGQSVEALYLGGYAAWHLKQHNKAREMLDQAVYHTNSAGPAAGLPGEGDTIEGGAMLSERTPCDLFQLHIAGLKRLAGEITPELMNGEYAALEKTLKSG